MNSFGAFISGGVFGLAVFSIFLTTQTTQLILMVSSRDNSLSTALVAVSATAIVATVDSCGCTEFCAPTPKNKKINKLRGKEPTLFKSNNREGKTNKVVLDMDFDNPSDRAFNLMCVLLLLFLFLFFNYPFLT